MSQERIQRWTDVALKREGGTEITKGAARLYSALLVRETEGLLKLVLTRPARVNGDPVIAYECSRNLLDHQIWAAL